MFPDSFYITELNRRLSQLIRIGTIIEIDVSGSIPKAKVKLGDLISPWLPMLTTRAANNQSFDPYEPAEQVLVLSPCGDLAQGVIVGALNQLRYPAPEHNPDVHCIEYQDGAKIQYDRKQHQLSVNLPKDATITIKAQGGLIIKGDVWIDGQLTATQDIRDHTRSLAEDRAIYNQHTHPNTQPVIEKQ